jgi:GPH family glycoside/pentoside/hexuronide:cation symporter
LLAVYAANNLPYSALSGVLTGNMADRNSLSAYRFVAVMFAQFIIQVLLLPLVLMLGHGDKAVGFHNTMFFFSITGGYLFYHDSILSKGVTHLRSVKMTELTYRPDGSIVTIHPYRA